MPDFHDGPGFTASTGHARGMLSSSPATPTPKLPTVMLPSQGAALWTSPAGLDAGSNVASVPFAYQAARWERIARRVWSGRNNSADIPQWIRQDLSPSTHTVRRQAVPDQEEEAQLPLHYGLDPTEMLQATNVSLVTRSVPMLPLTPRSLPDADLAAPYAVPAKSAGASASILQFPAGVEYVFPDDRLPAAYSDSASMPIASTTRQTIAVFSLAGGTGRTSIAAGMARVLAGSGLRVLLADTSAFSLLPRLFGGGESRQGVLRRFLPVTGGRNQMITQVSLAVEPFAGDDVEQYRILHEFSRETGSMDRIVWDLGGAPLDWAAKVLRISTRILIPLLPNMQSLVQLRATKSFLDRCQEGRSSLMWNYVLNGFDETDEAHVDIRGRLRQLLGEEVLEETLRSSPLVDEALSRGRTVFDHAPHSGLAADFWRLGRRIRQVEEHPDEAAPSASEWVEP